MKKNILFIHSGGNQGQHEGSNGLVAYLRGRLAGDYRVLYPKMPDPEHPEYAQWRHLLAKQLGSLNGDLILVGHSLGGSVLLKYLSEERCQQSIAGLFLIAAPYWGKRNWEADEYLLREDFFSRLPPIGRVFLYHSRNDEVVPFRHLLFYAHKLPNAIVREFDSGLHLFSRGLPELVDDIRSIRLEKKPGK